MKPPKNPGDDEIARLDEGCCDECQGCRCKPNEDK